MNVGRELCHSAIFSSVVAVDADRTSGAPHQHPAACGKHGLLSVLLSTAISGMTTERIVDMHEADIRKATAEMCAIELIKDVRVPV